MEMHRVVLAFAVLVLVPVASGQATLDIDPKLLDLLTVQKRTIDVCLVQDATGSFANDCENLIAQVPVITALFGGALGARFGLSSFKDYSDGVDVYRSILTQGSGMDLLEAVENLCEFGISGGGDSEEAQYDAFVKAASLLRGGCGWRRGSIRFMIGVTDAGCHVPADGPSYINDEASTIAALNAQSIIFIGLATGTQASACLQPLSLGTGGGFETITSTSSNIGSATGKALRSITL